ncbi:MAG: hypothetical protein IT378_24390, partial [Sandaracinaceae bacterium]|nr:hypothetical protein [Sandaracinaceae bacterium]
MTTGERDSSGTDLRMLARRFTRPAVAADDEVRPNGALGPPIVLQPPRSRRGRRRASRIGGAIALGLLAA